MNMHAPTPVPSKCLSCGLVFSSGAISISNCDQITLGSNFENCPQCGGLARMVEGTFDALGQKLEVIQASSFDRQLIEQLNNILFRYQAGSLSEKEATDELLYAHPEASETLRKIPKGKLTAFLILAIVALKQCSVNVEVSLDVNRLFDKIIETQMSSGD
jgi:hypothetical protein